MRFLATCLLGAVLSGCIDDPEFQLLPDPASDAAAFAASAETGTETLDGGPSGTRAADGGPPEKSFAFDGAYATTLTNGVDVCGLLGWADGAVENVTVRYKRDGAARATAEVEGLLAMRISLFVGPGELAGTAAVSSVTLARTATKKEKEGKCDFNWRVRMTTDFDGTTAVGKIFYEQVVIERKADCAAAILCTNVQTTRGTRVD